MNLVSKMFGVTYNTAGIFMRFTHQKHQPGYKNINFTLKPCTSGYDSTVNICSSNIDSSAFSDPDILISELDSDILSCALDVLRANVKPIEFDVDAYLKGTVAPTFIGELHKRGTTNLINTILSAANGIAVKTRRGAGNVAFISENLARSINLNQLNGLLTDDLSKKGPYIGTLFGAIDLYCLPIESSDEIFITYRGKHIGEYGLNIRLSEPTQNIGGAYETTVSLEGGLIGGFDWYEYIKIK